MLPGTAEVETSSPRLYAKEILWDVMVFSWHITSTGRV